MKAAFLFGVSVALSFETLLSGQEEVCSSGAEVIKTVFADYTKEKPPPSLPVKVLVEIWIQSFVGFDETLSEFTLDIYLSNQWDDKRLDSTNFIQMAVPCEDGQTLRQTTAQKLWTPNLNFIKSRKLKEYKSPNKNTFVIMYRNGTIWTNDRYQITIPCTQNHRHFPFTKLKCSDVYTSYSYDTNVVISEWIGVMLFSNISSPAFQFDKQELIRSFVQYPVGKYAELGLTLFFSRNWGSYIVRVYVPALAVTLLVWFGFFFGAANVTARSLLSMFAIAVLTYLFHTGARTTATWFTMLHLYLATCLAFVVAAACELAVVSMMHRRAENISGEKERRSAGGRRSDGFLPISTNDFGSSRRRNRCPTVVDMSAAGLFMLLLIIFHVAYVVLIALVVLA